MNPIAPPSAEGDQLPDVPVPNNPYPVTVVPQMQQGKRPNRALETATKIDVRVGSKYRVLEKLGEGGFGEIYRGVNILTHDMVAIKLEPQDCKNQHLLPEARLYKMLGPDGPRGSTCQVDPGVPRVHWYGLEGDYYVMVIDMLGPSLEDVFNFCSRRFSLKTVIHLGVEMLSRIEHVHSKHVIHRDVKPDNFLLGRGAKGTDVYIIDFGLAKPFRCPKTYEHIKFRSRKHMLGTARYASLNTHFGYEQSRRDDLEAVSYILMYFLRGSLPWQGAGGLVKEKRDPRVPQREFNKKQSRKKYQIIKEMKLVHTPASLGKGFPKEFQYLLEYTRALNFADKPNYAFLRSLLIDLRDRKGIPDDLVFEWTHGLAREKPEDDTLMGMPGRASPSLATSVTSPQPHLPGGFRSSRSSVSGNHSSPDALTPVIAGSSRGSTVNAISPARRTSATKSFPSTFNPSGSLSGSAHSPPGSRGDLQSRGLVEIPPPSRSFDPLANNKNC